MMAFSVTFLQSSHFTPNLPGHHLVQQEFLFLAGTCEVDAGGLDALMPEKIRQ